MVDLRANLGFMAAKLDVLVWSENQADFHISISLTMVILWIDAALSDLFEPPALPAPAARSAMTCLMCFFGLCRQRPKNS